MLRACLDSNIWVSGLVYSGPPRAIVSLALGRKFHVVTSPFILNEVERVLSGKLQVPSRQAKRIARRIHQIADVYDLRGSVDLIKEDPTDNYVLETAWIGRAKYLVSGDRHILPLKTFKNVKIVNAASFHEIIAR